MFFDNVEFHAMQSSLDALWMQQQATLQNIANYETPGYKAQNISFEDVLKEEGAKTGGGKYAFKADVFVDENAEVRPDGNNVNMEAENIKLMQNYYQSLYLYQKISGQMGNFRYVLNNAFK